MAPLLRTFCLVHVTPLLLLVSLAPGNGQEAAAPPSRVHLTLPQAVDMAIAHNRKLELARLSVQDAKQGKRIAQSHYFPNIANESATLHITELEGIVLPAGALSAGAGAGLIPSQTLRIAQGGSTSYTSGTGLEQPFTQMFKIHAGVRSAQAELNSANIEAEDAAHTLSVKVHQLYFSYLIEQLNGTVAENAAQASATAEEEAQKDLAEGRLLPDAELERRADLLEKRRATLTSRLHLDDLTLELDNTLGLPLSAKLELDTNSLGEQPVLLPRDEAMRAVLGTSPAVLAARQNLEKARAGLAAARDAYIPDVTGIARYSYQSGLPFFVHNFGTFGVSVHYDLFDGGAREAKLKDARVKLSMAQAQLDQTESDVQVELSGAYDKVEQTTELLHVAQVMLEARQESSRIRSQRAQVNAELASGVAAATAAAALANLNVMSAKLTLYLAQCDIARLLGQMPH